MYIGTFIRATMPQSRMKGEVYFIACESDLGPSQEGGRSVMLDEVLCW